MTLAHANDRAGRAASEASRFCHVVQHNLLVIASNTAPPEQRLEAAERLFQAFGPFCKIMAELEVVCPNAATAGYQQAAKLREHAERSLLERQGGR